MATQRCYICQQEDLITNLVRPCTNEECKATAHRKCLSEQVDAEGTQEHLCGSCRTPLAYRSKSIKKRECCCFFIKIGYLAIMMIMGFMTIFLMSLGTDANMDMKNCTFLCLHGNLDCCEYNLGMLFVGSLLISFLFFQLFVPGYSRRCGMSYDIFHCGCIDRSKIKYKKYITIFIMFLFTNVIIIINHLLGALILLHYDINEFFTYRTGLMGYAVDIILLCIISLIILIILGFIALIRFIKVKFTNVEYGVELNENTPLFRESDQK
jgi:hypothetical protein